jgi:serine O-acetyltransferase
MINSKEEYKFYIEADKIALGIKEQRPGLLPTVWKFQRLLRKIEYYKNCRKSILWKPYVMFLHTQFDIMSNFFGFTIPPDVFGPGLAICHAGTIIINHTAKVGANCRLHAMVSIGTKAGTTDRAPSIGSNVYIGPGAKIFGPIYIADGIAIGANSVVNKSFYEPNITIAGIPAKKISDKGSEGLLIKATDLISNGRFEKIKKKYI